MNSLAMRHLIWKEWREIGPIFWGLSASFALALLFWWVSSTADLPMFDLKSGLMPTVYMFINTCALLIGACLFAPEKENGTSVLLGNLPIGGLQLVFQKLLIGAAVLILFTTFCLGLTSLVCVLCNEEVLPFLVMGGSPVEESIEQAILLAECFFFGLLWSLLLHQTLYALIFSAASVVLINAIAGNLISAATGNWVFQSIGLERTGVSINSSWLMRVPMLAIIVGAVILKASSWLRLEQSSSRSWSIGAFRRMTMTSSASLNSSDLRKPSGVLSSLIWQSFRQASGMYCVTLVIGGILILPVFFSGGGGGVFAILNIFLAAITGAYVFVLDQSNHQFRFFQQHGGYSRRLWFARLLPAILLTGFISMILAIGFEIADGQWVQGELTFWERYQVSAYEVVSLRTNLISILSGGLLGLALGQFFSLFVRSGLLALFCASLSVLVAVVWYFLVCVCGANLGLFIVVPALVLFAATWWFAPQWVDESSTRLATVFPWVVMSGVVGAMLVGFFCFRANDVRPIETSMERDVYFAENAIGFELGTEWNRAYLAPITAPRNGEGALYERPYWSQLIRGNDDEFMHSFVEKNSEQLNGLRQAISKNTYPALDKNLEGKQLSPMDYRVLAQDLEMLSQADFEVQLQAGELEKALQSWKLAYVVRAQSSYSVNDVFDVLIRWAMHDGQNRYLLGMAMRWLSENQKDLDLAMSFEFGRDFQMECNEIAAGNYGSLAYALPQISQRLFYFLPWELERTRRVGAHLIEHSRFATNELSPWNEIYEPRSVVSRQGSVWPNRFNDLPIGIQEKARSTPMIPYFVLQYLDQSVQNQNRLRYCQVRLALEAYRLKHGHYPKRLHDLTTAPLFDNVDAGSEEDKQALATWGFELPCDIFSGDDFAYYSEGLDFPVTVFGQGSLDRMHEPSLSKSAVIWKGPFLLPWSAGPPQNIISVEVLESLEGGQEESQTIQAINLKPQYDSFQYWEAENVMLHNDD